MTTVIDRKRAMIAGGLLFVGGFGIGLGTAAIFAALIHQKKDARNTEPRIVKLYPDGVDPETWMCEDDELEDSEIAKEIAEENGYVVETEDDQADRESVESSEQYSKFVEKNPFLVTIISPNYDKRSEEINNALDFMDNEMLLYFPDEDILATETGDRVDPTEVVGNCLTKYGFSTDDDQREIEVINVQYQTHYIVRKETENSFEDLFPSE